MSAEFFDIWAVDSVVLELTWELVFEIPLVKSFSASFGPEFVEFEEPNGLAIGPGGLTRGCEDWVESGVLAGGGAGIGTALLAGGSMGFGGSILGAEDSGFGNFVSGALGELFGIKELSPLESLDDEFVTALSVFDEALVAEVVVALARAALVLEAVSELLLP